MKYVSCRIRLHAVLALQVYFQFVYGEKFLRMKTYKNYVGDLHMTMLHYLGGPDISLMMKQSISDAGQSLCVMIPIAIHGFQKMRKTSEWSVCN